jgi:hypothetical protein
LAYYTSPGTNESIYLLLAVILAWYSTRTHPYGVYNYWRVRETSHFSGLLNVGVHLGEMRTELAKDKVGMTAVVNLRDFSTR